MTDPVSVDQLKTLVSEGRNVRSAAMDTLSTLDMLRLINAEDVGVASAVEIELPQIARSVDLIAAAFREGGRLIYCGAGTSGRLGHLDASECPPTFGVSAGMVVALMAGGEAALTQAMEGAEDDAALGAADLAAAALAPRDVVVGIAASGRTPYVLGALEFARKRGATTIALTCNPNSPAAALAAVSIAPIVGAEVLTGSTRMKAGTAQKLVLNMLSTGSMIRIGRTFGNLMVDLQASNQKLAARALGIVAEATGCTASRATELLALTDGGVKAAILMELAGIGKEEAQARLEAAGGALRAALDPDRAEGSGSMQS
jgi:N-acetylmuramic acid 6-phosphate etherase